MPLIPTTQLVPTGQRYYSGTGDAWNGGPPSIPGIFWRPAGGGYYNAYVNVPTPSPVGQDAADPKPASRVPELHFNGSPYQPLPPGNYPELFQPDKYPVSESFSGLAPKWSNKIAKGVIPQLVARAQALPETIDRYTSNAARLYERQSRQAMEGSLPGLLARIGNRGVLNSSVASDAISQLGAQIVPTFANRAYAAAMEAARMHYGVPGILGNIAGLARYSQSRSENQLAPYQLLANFVATY